MPTGARPSRWSWPNLAGPAVGAVLTERGYRLTSYENVFGFPRPGEHGRSAPEGIEIRSSGEEEFDRWIEVVADGFAHPDTQGVSSHEAFPHEVIAAAVRDLVGAAGMRRYSAVCDGALVGGASARMDDGIAQLTGATTAPAHRRRGVQAPRSQLLRETRRVRGGSSPGHRTLCNCPGPAARRPMRRAGRAVLLG
ncbi:GNAT family N-acetyltransferase, partial [Streptomyces sp. TRM76130]|nr:GNAT family N-acetyltransferase [Streptomyces sp. TRM76130]